MTEKKLALCCKSFPLPVDYLYLKDNYEKWLRNTPKEDYTQIQDIWILYPMLIPSNKSREIDKKIFYYYSCKHLINDRCSIQDNKPEICKRFSKKDCICIENNYKGCKSDCFKKGK